MEKKLVQLVEHYLSVHLVDNAIFMAERLIGISPSEANKHLLATCHVHAGQPKQAVSCLQGCRDPANRYLLARCLVFVRDFAEAEDALLQPAGLRGKNVEEIARAIQKDPSIVPHGSAGVELLAQAALSTERFERAISLFQLSLQLDPFLWTSFEALVSLGAAPEPGICFHGNTLQVPFMHPAATGPSSGITGVAVSKQRAHSQSDVEVMRQHSGVKRGFAEVSSGFEPSGENKLIPRVAVPIAHSSPLTPAMKLQLGSPEGVALAPVGPNMLSSTAEQSSSAEDGLARRRGGNVPDLQKRRGRFANSEVTPAVSDSRSLASASVDSQHTNPVQALTFSATSSVSLAHPAFASIPGRLVSAFQSLPRASETPSGIHDMSSIAGTPAAGVVFGDSCVQSAVESSNRIIGMSYTPLVHKMKSFSLESQPRRPALSSDNPARSLWFSEVEDSLGPASIIMSKKLTRSKSEDDANASQARKLHYNAHYAQSTRTSMAKTNKARVDEEETTDKPESLDAQIYRGGLQLLALLRCLGSIRAHVDSHCLELAVAAANRLPACHTQTGYVMYLLARSFAEAGKYLKVSYDTSEQLMHSRLHP
jgi:tetratricopeptide (TPR) repeat protein